ncbi:hypothetical protein OO013_05875 [Mangrovivirga sp. M17]|uniref:Tetratricopeptide repeat protein n=1 Tax=Mangrovivirga halotolerans TaxID=2993936 RepID=A0ABT3RNK6_9BACT|nr:hypothetical protein [Mangrovivirga halotolerans]MCX2743384.1 hypothetical protein [Mangrovivirga halotolerans]
MNNNFLANKKSTTGKILQYVLFLAFLGAGTWCLVAYFNHGENIFPWNELYSLQKVTQPLFSFSLVTSQFNILAENFVGIISYGAGLMTIQEDPFFYHLIIFFLGLSVILSALPALHKYYFYLGISLVMLILIWSDIDSLLLFGRLDKIPVVFTIILLLGPTLFFKFRSKQTKFGRRWIINLLTILFFALIVINFSELDRPLMLLSANLVHGSLIIFGVTVLFTAHDLLTLVAYYIGGNTRSNPTYLQFIFAFLLLSGNLILLYLGFHEDLNIDLVLAPAIILFIGAYLGGWLSWKLKLKEGEFIIDWNVDGKFLYLGFGLVSLGLIGFQAATAIDTLLYSINDLIIFLHLGLLFSFFIYVIINFNQFLKQGIRIGDNLYRPKIIPYVSVFVFGTVIGLGLYFITGQLVTKYGKASHQSLIGDYYYYLDQRQQAEVYFRRSRFIANRNIHANMAMASLMRLRGEKVREQVFYAEAVKLSPDLRAQLNSIRLLREEGREFEALFNINEVEQYYSDDPEYWIARGAAYSNVKIYDSAVWSFEKAYDLGFEEKAIANIMAIESLLKVGDDTDSLNNAISPEDQSDLYRGNLIALKNFQKEELSDFNFTRSDSVLDKPSFILLNNGVVNQIMNLKDSIEELERYRFQIQNAEFLGSVEQLSIFRNYVKGNFTASIYELGGLAGSSTGSYYRFLQGMLMADMYHPDLAAEYFFRAEESGFEGSAWVGIIALLESGNLSTARDIYTDAINSGSVPPDYLKEHEPLLMDLSILSVQDQVVILKELLIENPYTKANELMGVDTLSSEVRVELSKFEASKGRSDRAKSFTNDIEPQVDPVTGMILGINGPVDQPESVREKIYSQFFSSYKELSSDDLESMALDLLYETPLILIIAEELTSRDEILKANNVLANAYNNQSQNESLRIAYVISSAKAGLEDYARKTFSDIRSSIPADSVENLELMIEDLLQQPSTDWE